MSRRHFVETPMREDGQPVPRYRLVCGSCGVGETLGRQNFGGSIADTQVPKKFEEKGWSVGKRHDGRDDRCPACVNREQEAHRRRTAPNPTEEKLPMSKPIETALKELPAAPTAEKPRQMTRDERRLIWAKLEEVYVDERRGYSGGWTDLRVAEDLGIPRAWVSTIRDENFGPDSSEEMQTIRQALEAAKLASLQIIDEHTHLAGRITQITTSIEKYMRMVERIEATSR